MAPIAQSERVSVDNLLEQRDPDIQAMEILSGLINPPRRIASVFLYNKIGSELFEEITRLPEYYLTRIELDLIKAFTQAPPYPLEDIDIVEYGSGDIRKISLLLDATGNPGSVRYHPIDISLTALEKSGHSLVDRYPAVTVHPVAADFSRAIDLQLTSPRRLFCFFGSTLGNLPYHERIAFLSMVNNHLRSGDVFLLGVDLVKSREILQKAYNDRDGVTARFNRNILYNVNALAGTDFKPHAFEHVAFYNPYHSRIEMHLRAISPMTVSSPRYDFQTHIRRHEMIHTENSRKFTIPQIAREAGKAGLRVNTILVDPKKWYALIQLSSDSTRFRNA